VWLVGWFVGFHPLLATIERSIDRSDIEFAKAHGRGGLAEFVNMVSGNMESLCRVVAFDFCLCRELMEWGCGHQVLL